MQRVQKEKVQNAKSAKGEEYKTKTLQRVKVQHEIVQYINRVQHEKKSNMKRFYTKKCNVEMVQCEKSVT